MEDVGRGRAASGVENERVDDGLMREEQEQREEKSSLLRQAFEKMEWEREAESENISSAITAPAPGAVEEVDFDAAAESTQMNDSRLLQLTCKFDSTTSLSSLLEGVPVDALDDSGLTALHYAAEQHSVRCIEFLLKRRAKTDVKSSEGLIALEIALQSERMQRISWSPADKITELLSLTGDQDLTAIKILARHTHDVAQVASRLIVQGNIVAFAALLTVTGETLISTAVLSTDEHGDGTLFDVIVKKTISTGEHVEDDHMNDDGCPKPDGKQNSRQILLKELALLLRWYLDHDQTSGINVRRRTPPTSSVPSPMMRAAQAGDVAVVGILIDHGADVNETDSGGNTALHWSLRASVNTRDIRLVLQLLRHGGSITMGNRLGLTPVHIAAGQGHLQALQILLAVEPSSVHVSAETRETPLFSAVKGNHYDCVRLLLQHGASRQVLNLRKQRPIDVAGTSDMRALLSFHESSGRAKDVNSMISPSMFSFTSSDYAHSNYAYNTEQLRFQSETSQLLGYPDESLKSLTPGQLEMCRYFSMPGGCVRGDKCFYAHREEELQGQPKVLPGETTVKQGLVPFNAVIAPARTAKRVSEDLNKKIFVGGLSPSVESDDLREFFEGKFGAVIEAIVIGSNAGDHVQSRGFGFVTFKHDESVVAAVQAHYVNIFGKKVEIKGAVPRSVLPALESMKVGLESSSSGSAESSKFSEIDVTKVLDLPSLELLCQAKGDLQVQLMNYMGYQGEHCAPPFKLSLNEEPTTALVPASSASPRLPFATSQGATWVAKFKQWLPKFLAEVSNRLKEGEWYPLSSLKGDFRATCGLELDHLAMGYQKLSDFVRSIPELCRMKIVPVGRGPATHMVLLPALVRLSPTLGIPAQAPKTTGPTACSSLVDAGRSYAAAACQLPAKRTTDHYSTGQSESRNVYDNVPLASSMRSRNDELRLPDLPSHNITMPTDAGVDYALHTSIPQSQPGTLMQEADRSTLRELLALMDNYDEQRSEERVAVQGTAEYVTTSNFNSAGQNFVPQSRPGLTLSSESRVESSQEEPKTPVHQVSLRPFSKFNHPFTGFLPQDCSINTGYSMWGQQLGQQNLMQNNETIINRNQQSMSAKSSDQTRLWDDSPQSILHPYERNYSKSGMIEEAPRSLFSPAGNSPTDNQVWTPRTLCVYCCERESLWISIPCGHHALCAICKDALHKLNRSTANCPVCASHVERWIALH